MAKNHKKTFYRELAGITRMGVNMHGIADATEFIIKRKLGMLISLESNVKEGSFPFIVTWRKKTLLFIKQMDSSHKCNFIKN